MFQNSEILQCDEQKKHVIQIAIQEATQKNEKFSNHKTNFYLMSDTKV